jgi:ribonucleotide reductase alpha subunit
VAGYSLLYVAFLLYSALITGYPDILFHFLNRARTDINEINKEIIKIKIINQELEAKTVTQDGDLSELKTDSEATKMNMQLM